MTIADNRVRHILRERSHCPEIPFIIKPFDELTPLELHGILMLREEVFLREQRCDDQEIDLLDRVSIHIFHEESPGKIGAYLRILPPDTHYPEPSLGRVAVAKELRGHSVGSLLVAMGMDAIEHYWDNRPVRISAQGHLTEFYRPFGFVTCSGLYDEAGIPHVEMLAQNW